MRIPYARVGLRTILPAYVLACLSTAVIPTAAGCNILQQPHSQVLCAKHAPVK